MRVVCYSCSHGLTPGPYTDWSEAHRDEHRWLLDVVAGPLRATHVVLPTEAFARAGQGYTHERAAWLCEQAWQRSLQPVIWVDKWLYTEPVEVIRSWLRTVYEATVHITPDFLLISEGDLLWELHPVSRRLVLQNLLMAKEELLDAGLSPRQVWAGGATVPGTVAIGNALAPEYLTWTAWRALQRGIAGGSAQSIYHEVLADLDALRATRGHSRLVAVEIGWSAANGGETLQGVVLEQAGAAARDLAIVPGLWTIVDWPHDVKNGPIEAAYGVLNQEGLPRPAFAAWGLAGEG